MYADTITLFNRYEANGVITWYPTVLRNVDLNIDRAAMIAKYGEQTADSAALHIKYTVKSGEAYIGDKRYLPPKRWAAQEDTEREKSITFTGGTNFDFFIVGEWAEAAPIVDDPMQWLDGVYNYMNKRFDYVFSVNSVAQYSVIPHFEITAK